MEKSHELLRTGFPKVRKWNFRISFRAKHCKFRCKSIPLSHLQFGAKVKLFAAKDERFRKKILLTACESSTFAP